MLHKRINMKCAPVLIITLDRSEKFKKCIESLKNNLYADCTDLFIAIDYPKTQEQFDGYLRTLTYLKEISGFKTINIIKREVNFGIIRNYLEAKNFILTQNDSIIFTEDDNEFSEDFLNFMNKCLIKYKNNKTIFSISGYNYPVVMPNKYTQNVYKWMGHSAWGFGIWKDRWEQIIWNPDFIFNSVEAFLHDYISVYKFQKIANHYLPAIINIFEEKKMSGDGYICLHQYKHGFYSIFPVISRVRNHGHDGTGRSNSVIENSIYNKQELYTGSSKYELPEFLETNKEINLSLNKHFKIPKISRIKAFAKLVLLNSKPLVNKPLK